jgi:hypothetical protein
VSSRTHTQLEEEDLANEGTKAEGRRREKERDEHFNTIRSMISTKQEWRVKEKISMPTLIAFDDNMDLMDDDESPLIKDGSLSPTSMDINMVFTLSTEFRGVSKEITQMCLGPKEAMFEKPEESSQHLKPLYIRGHISKRPISRMLIDGGAAINLMSYPMFKKLGREYDELVKKKPSTEQRGGGGGKPEGG